MSVKPKLERHTQIAIGEALRAYLVPSWSGIPPQLMDLWRRLQEIEDAEPRAPEARLVPAPTPAEPVEVDGPETQCFDPEALTVLNAAFDEGWTTLRSLGGTQVTKEALAERILELAADGERSAPRLASKALISAIAPHTKQKVGPAS